MKKKVWRLMGGAKKQGKTDKASNLQSQSVRGDRTEAVVVESRGQAQNAQEQTDAVVVESHNGKQDVGNKEEGRRDHSKKKNKEKEQNNKEKEKNQDSKKENSHKDNKEKEGKDKQTKKKRAMLYVDLTEQIRSRLEAFLETIPPRIQCDNQGRPGVHHKRTPLHVTMLLDVDGDPKVMKEQGETLHSLTTNSPPFTISFSPFFFEQVDRIKSSVVYCMGVKVVDDAYGSMVKLRARAHEAIEGRIPYPGPGHISLAYFPAQHEKEAREIWETHGELLSKEEMVVDHINLTASHSHSPTSFPLLLNVNSSL